MHHESYGSAYIGLQLFVENHKKQNPGKELSLMVITGKGLHCRINRLAVGEIALKEAVAKLAADLNLKISCDEKNSGCYRLWSEQAPKKRNRKRRTKNGLETGEIKEPISHANTNQHQPSVSDLVQSSPLLHTPISKPNGNRKSETDDSAIEQQSSWWHYCSVQ